MSAGLLLIDGYNLLHAAGMAQSDYRPGDLLRCRTRLLKLLLSKLPVAEIKATTIVFDARDPPPDRPAQVVVSGIRVLFANPDGDADVFIQNWLSHHPAPRRVTLVSSDRVLQRAARSCGAKFVSSEDFVETLERRRGSKVTVRGRTRTLTDDSKPTARASAEQMAYWLNVFGDVRVVEPDTDDQPSEPPRPAAPSKSKPAAATSPRNKRPRKPRSQEDSKPAGSLGGDELAYWMRIFGSLPAAGSSAASTEELRLSDLESWLKDYEAKEGGAANQRE